MPTYDYHCDSCDTRFEVTRRMGDTTPQECPDCGTQARRVFTPVGVAFKGSGFHNTDYRPRPKEASSDSGAGCAAKDASSSKCASCPAATDG